MFRNTLEPLKTHSRNTHIIKTKKLKMFLNSFHYMQFSPTFGVTLMGLLSGVFRALYDSVKSAKCCCQPKTNSAPKQEAITLSKALKSCMYGRPWIYISTEYQKKIFTSAADSFAPTEYSRTHETANWVQKGSWNFHHVKCMYLGIMVLCYRVW